MELKHTAVREGRLSSFLREEMGMSVGLMNRLKWQEKLFVNGISRHADFPVQPGDVITAVDGKAMTSTELVSFVGQASVGQQIVFSIYRQGDTLEITVDVGEQIQSALEQQQEQQTQQGYPGNFPWGRP